MRFLLINYFNEVVCFSRTKSQVEVLSTDVADEVVRCGHATYSINGQVEAWWEEMGGDRRWRAPKRLA